ncbi:sulfocyanin-like copper-binding protein [Paenarthrobacter sp. DKR-5]|uniref:sulfocyanin-like copper-binding protein n=1 Tax=Paenarthrobacter sp. DKR-5 TaxID=2835535 RepID=UPI0027DC9B75|nr:sulfocyanin-like copper-binding protein [Paenarthrobacter sp. DKR-5]
MTGLSRRSTVLVGVLATLALTALSIAALGFLPPRQTGLFAGRAGCSVPGLAGAVVDVTATDMGGPMMGAMRLTSDRATVAHGRVSFLVTNAGRYTHEMVILPLPGTGTAGTRPVGGDGKIDETGSLGEASASCAEGAGQGILPRTVGWLSLDLAPGRYELVCNFPGHYSSGMYTQLTVT